jgi:hypothetical protein
MEGGVIECGWKARVITAECDGAEEAKYRPEPYKKLKKVPPQAKPFDALDVPSTLTASGRRPSRSSNSSLTPICEEAPEEGSSQLGEVRTLTEKLQLRVRRPSILEWKARQAEDRRLRCLQKNKTFVTCSSCLTVPPALECICANSSVPVGDKNQRIAHALAWLKQELVSFFSFIRIL